MKLPRVRSRWASLAFPVACVVALASLAASTSLAQDQTGHPAHIHLGTCSELGEIAYPLSNVGPGVVREGEVRPRGEEIGETSDIYPVNMSVTTIDATLADIVNGPHALNVHESASNIQSYIACGNIGGWKSGNSLVIGLEQLNDSGYTGIAVLREKTDQPQTVVTLYLAGGPVGGAFGAEPTTASEAAPTQESTAAPQPTAAAESAIEIASFAFAPNSLEIPAGTTVTWTNSDAATHTVTADNGIFDSGNLVTGGTFSLTFDTPGTYAYHCAIHPNMTATIVVT